MVFLTHFKSEFKTLHVTKTMVIKIIQISCVKHTFDLLRMLEMTVKNDVLLNVTWG